MNKKQTVKLPKGIVKNPNSDWQKRVLVFTPTTGLIRSEWAQARYGQIIPTNWSNVSMEQFLNPYVPVAYQLADAQNLMAQKVVEEDYQWVIFIEHDNVIPADGFVKFNEYINENKIPVVSGLYFTKTEPPEPIMYRGRGNSYYGDWKLGDKVWVDGVPFGFLLLSASLIKAAWKESPEYTLGNQVVRRVFEQPNKIWFDEEKGGMVSKRGTTDLCWCTRLMEEGLFKKAGWKNFQDMKYPFLVDTTIFVNHIDQKGKMYPYGGIPQKYLK